MTEKKILLYRTRTKRRLSLVPSGVRPPGTATREARARTGGVSLGRGVGHVDRHALDDVVLATQGLGHLQQARVTCHVAGGRQGDTHLRVQEGDEGKRSEGLRDEDIGDLSEL